MTNLTWTARTAARIGALALIAAPCAAQDASQIDNSPLVDKLAVCTTLDDNEERLACFDREARALVDAANGGDVKIVEKEAITEARRNLFGYTLPNAGLFKSDDKTEKEANRRLTSTITKVRKVSSIEWHIWIEEGDARWRLRSEAVSFRAPKIGDTVEFKPAAMGTFWVRVNGRTRVRGKRIG